MVGENFEFTCLKWLDLSTKVGENFEFTCLKWLDLSTMFGENFEFTCLKWLKIHLNYPPWLEKVLNLLALNG